MKVDVVVGLQYGDEGKGKAAAYLASKFNYDLVCRANGGPNAGHTVVTDKGKTFKLSQLPGASPYCNAVYIGAGCVVSISKLVEEIEILRAYKPSFKVMIHKNTHVIMEHHVEQDIKLEETYNIGTTKKGIGPCYAEAALRTGETIDNVLNNLNFSEGYVNALRDFTEDGHVSIITGLYVDARSVLVEMSQGYELDPFIGNYPYVTSSSSHPGFACASLNIPTQAIRSIYGVLKPYVTYVGGDESFKDLEKNGKRGLIGLKHICVHIAQNGFACTNCIVLTRKK